jgi:hypothetical protein
VQTGTRIAVKAVLVPALLLVLSACGGLRESLGIGTKRAPDEFTVVKRAPLVLPPNYNLRPPRPGAPRPQELQPTQAARSALVASAGGTISRRDSGRPATAATGGPTSGELALMKRAGTDDVEPNIRQLIDAETSILVAKSASFTDRLIFWQEKPQPGQVVDPQKEASRIQENSATGQPVTTGATPVIRHRKRGFLEGIF